MKNIDFEKAKNERRKKNNDYDNILLAEDFYENVKNGNITDYVIIYQNKDKYYNTYHSEMYLINAIGMLEIGKDYFLTEMKDD